MVDSWPVNPIFLRPTFETDDTGAEDLDLIGMDTDPLQHFLTPAPPQEEEDVDILDFDAGIEDATRPPQIVRSVSPSSLHGLSRLAPRPPTPPRPPSSPSPDPDVDVIPTPGDEESEQYVQLGAVKSGILPLGLPLGLKDFRLTKKTVRAKRNKEDGVSSRGLLSPTSIYAGRHPHRSALSLPPDSPSPPSPVPSLSSSPSSPPAFPASPPSSSMSGRSTHTSGPRGVPSAAAKSSRSRNAFGASSRGSIHAWREPSPDVWSIEEEPERETDCAMGEGSATGENQSRLSLGDIVPNDPDQKVQTPGAKPRKKVRFILPATEIY
ncbi:hypothetical protein VTK73DRAFT_1596 [Phialemonium thermophilum]|uniref:Uncharacterized protein n=1 Tax=Phialemonium thermophilum TaxID=223376 RepID=A0ABR3Y371_9PEZI